MSKSDTEQEQVSFLKKLFGKQEYDTQGLEYEFMDIEWLFIVFAKAITYSSDQVDILAEDMTLDYLRNQLDRDVFDSCETLLLNWRKNGYYPGLIQCSYAVEQNLLLIKEIKDALWHNVGIMIYNKSVELLHSRYGWHMLSKLTKSEISKLLTEICLQLYLKLVFVNNYTNSIVETFTSTIRDELDFDEPTIQLVESTIGVNVKNYKSPLDEAVKQIEIKRYLENRSNYDF